MSNTTEHPDPDDMFNDTRMSLGDHIEDLRTHLLRALKGFAVGMILGLWPVGPWVLDIIKAPVEEQLNEFEERKLAREIEAANERASTNNLVVPAIIGEVWLDSNDLREGLGLKADEDLPKKSGFIKVRSQIVDPLAFSNQVSQVQVKVKKHQVSAMGITEAFMVWFKVSLLAGLVISSPWVFYHIWSFFAAGLYPTEKKLVNVYLPISLFLFIAGVLLCQFVVMQNAVKAMLWFNEWLGISADLRLSEWLSFALLMPLVFGVCFQTPLVMMFLHKIGLLSVQTFREKRRIAWFVMAVFAAVITPSVDAFSMLFLWVPMGFLYELGIVLCVWQGKNESLAEWEIEEKQNELVEV
jgi:sec-independent protein translocase protein TatC